MSGPAEEQESTRLGPLLAHTLRHWKLYLVGVVSLAAVDFINSNILTRLLGIPFALLDKEGAPKETSWLDALLARFLGEPGAHPSAGYLAAIAAIYVTISIAQLGLRYVWRY